MWQVSGGSKVRQDYRARFKPEEDPDADILFTSRIRRFGLPVLVLMINLSLPIDENKRGGRIDNLMDMSGLSAFTIFITIKILVEYLLQSLCNWNPLKVVSVEMRRNLGMPAALGDQIAVWFISPYWRGKERIKQVRYCHGTKRFEMDRLEEEKRNSAGFKIYQNIPTTQEIHNAERIAWKLNQKGLQITSWRQYLVWTWTKFIYSFGREGDVKQLVYTFSNARFKQREKISRKASWKIPFSIRHWDRLLITAPLFLWSDAWKNKFLLLQQ